MRYQADITAGSLKLVESRIITDLLLQGIDAHGWQDALFNQNILQARSPETAKRLGRLLRARFESMKPDLWRLVRDGSSGVATHACLAASVKHSPLLGDFLDVVVREQYRLFRKTLSYGLWRDYIEDCRNREPDLPQWSETTVKRLRSTVFQILAQAGYIENTRLLRLQPLYIVSEVLSYLAKNDEYYVLKCIQVSP
jgi:hypothetical protein